MASPSLRTPSGEKNPQRGKSKHYGEWRAEQEGRPTYLSLIKADVDKTIEEAIEIIKKDNLFQYPTERQVSRLTRACYSYVSNF